MEENNSNHKGWAQYHWNKRGKEECLIVHPEAVIGKVIFFPMCILHLYVAKISNFCSSS